MTTIEQEVRDRLADTGMDSSRIDSALGELATRDAAPMHLPNAAPTLQVLMHAIANNANLDRVEKLMALHERFEANEARKAYYAAFARFRAEPMEILKTKYVDIPGGAKFHHATLANVVDGVISSMSRVGLRHRWELTQDKGIITVTCWMTHELGHSEKTVLSGPPDTGGKKSEVQAIASTVTLLQRYTLLAAVGLAAKDLDDDPHSEGSKTEHSVIAKPGDYDGWRADTRALADEGADRLDDHWQKTPADIRRYVVVEEPEFWNECKALAKKATQQRKTP
jgi:hypothetical protein